MGSKSDGKTEKDPAEKQWYENPKSDGKTGKAPAEKQWYENPNSWIFIALAAIILGGLCYCICCHASNEEMILYIDQANTDFPSETDLILDVKELSSAQSTE